MRSGLIGLILVILVSVALISCEPTTSGKPAQTTPPPPGQEMIQSPWANCGEGTRVLIKQFNAETMEDELLKETVVKVETSEVIILTEIKEGEDWKKLGEETASLKQVPKPPGEPQVKSLKIKGKEYHCKIMIKPGSGDDKKVTEKLWMCEEIPGGIARREMNDIPVWEVIDFERKPLK